MAIVYRNIERKDNLSLAELIRNVFREFGIDRPGTVYFDPTTDDLYKLFRKPGSEYWVALDNEVIIGGCGVYPTPGLPEGCAELVALSASRNSSHFPLRGTRRSYRCSSAPRLLGFSELKNRLALPGS